MPYIPSMERRLALSFHRDTPKDEGELNYLATTLLCQYLDEHGLSYANCQAAAGALTEAVAEFRRRVMAPYEDGKIQSNGDCYPPHLTHGEEGWKRYQASGVEVTLRKRDAGVGPSHRGGLPND